MSATCFHITEIAFQLLFPRILHDALVLFLRHDVLDTVQPIQEHQAIQMVEFVLENAGEDIGVFALHGFPILGRIFRRDCFVPRHQPTNARDAPTSFPVFELLFRSGNDFRVDDDRRRQ
jgi:hypothetical protein